MRCGRRLILFFAVLFACTVRCYADLAVQFQADAPSINLAPHLSYLKTGETLSVDEVLKKPFVDKSSNRLDFGFVKSDIWLKIPFTVLNDGMNPDTEGQGFWYLLIDMPHIRELEVVQRVNGQELQHIVTGTSTVFATRKTNYPGWAIRIDTREGNHELLLRLRTTGPIESTIYLESSKGLIVRSINTHLVYGVMFGFYGLLVFFCITVFLVTRETVLLAGSALTISVFLAQLHFSGMGFQVVWPNTPELNPIIGRVAFGMSFASVGLFTHQFLRLWLWAPLLSKALCYLSIGLALSSVFPVFSYAPALALAVFFSLPLLALTATVRGVIRGIPSSKFLFAAYSLFCIFIALAFLDALSLVPGGADYVSFFDIGMTVMVILITFGLGSRFNEEKLRAQVSEERVKTRNTFLATMSHEIRTPMNGVIGMLNLLKKSSLDATQANQVRMAKSSADSLLVLINDILDFSKIDAGKLGLEVADFDLIAILEDTVESFSYPAYAKGLELILDTSAIDTRYISGDAMRLRQIVTNLIANAIKFTACGEVTVDVRTESSSMGTTLEICVSDSGVGIPPEKIRDLFDVFTQADESTTRNFGGTGLGLAIVKNLCELMKGEIKVASIPGQGSTFTAITKFAAREEPSCPQVVNLSGSGILIVHQNPHVSVALARLLKVWGADVLRADSVNDALQKLEGVKVDKVFFDSELHDWEKLQNGPFSSCELKRRGQQPKTHAHVSTPILRTELISYLSETPETSSTASIVELPAESKRRARLLLVEDNSINVAVALGILEDLGYQTEVAKDGRQAVELLGGSNEFDVILMDCQMPVMDGYQATKAIRDSNIGYLKSVPIVAMTANTMNGDREKCLASGMNDYVPKPIDPDELEEVLARWAPHI